MSHSLTAKLLRTSAASNTWTVNIGSAHVLTSKLLRQSAASNTWTVNVAAAGATWDTSEHVTCTANPMVFSSGDTVVSMGGSFPTGGNPNSIGMCGRATVAITSGQKKYCEIINNATEYNESGVGIIGTGVCPPWPSVTPPTDEKLLGMCGGISYTTAGNIYANGSYQTTYEPFYNDGDNVGIAVDFDAALVWFRVNGGDWNNDVIGNQNPATGVGGFDFSSLSGDIYFGYSVYWSDGNNGGNELNGPSTAEGLFDSGSWAYTAPSGFTSL